MVHYSDLNDFQLKQIILEGGAVEVKRKNHDTGEMIKEYYSEVIFTFDCETTSYFVKENKEVMMFDKYKDSEYYKGMKKQGELYIWMIGINKNVYYGRTISELSDFMKKIQMALLLNSGLRLKAIFYIHNLSFDFQFIMNALGTNFDIFAKESRGILTAKNDFFDFRCSLYLTMMGLGNFCEAYKIEVQKKTGDLDYNVMRTPLTELTEKELKYCEYDILCLYEIIEFHRNIYGTIYDIPLTQTGKIRREVKDLFRKNKKHHQLMKRAFPKTWEDFKLLNQVYQGGYTHANVIHSNKILKDVHSWDITSSYPFELCVEKYPMTHFCETTKGIKEVIKQQKENDDIAFIIDFTVEGLKSKLNNSFLSVSKAYTDTPDGCFVLDGLIADNGRIKEVKAGRFCMCDMDFFIFRQAYIWEKIQVNHIYTAKKDYLPKEFIEYILKLYKDKTELKGIEGKEGIYEEKKQFVNGLYGMCCTKFINDKIEFNQGTWKTTKINEEIAKQQLKEQSDKVIDLQFSWGVFCSSYARFHLWTKIIKLDEETAYCDTDSLKGFNIKKMKKVFEEDKQEVLSKIKKVCEHYDLDESLFSPKDKEGIIHTLGVFDYEAHYEEFKTVGAKKYAVKGKREFKSDGTLKKYKPNVEITVSGVNKKTGSESIKDLKYFNVGLFFDYDEAGKNISFYNDEQIEVIFPDGWKSECKRGICIMPSTYELGITKEYDDLIKNVCDLLK